MITHPNIMDIIRAASNELYQQQLQIWARLTPTRRLEMMFDLIEFTRQMLIATERQRNPQISEEELAQRVKRRIELAYED